MYFIVNFCNLIFNNGWVWQPSYKLPGLKKANSSLTWWAQGMDSLPSTFLLPFVTAHPCGLLAGRWTRSPDAWANSSQICYSQVCFFLDTLSLIAKFNRKPDLKAFRAWARNCGATSEIRIISAPWSHTGTRATLRWSWCSHLTMPKNNPRSLLKCSSCTWD